MFIPNWEKYRNKRPSGRVQVDWNNPLTNALAISTIDFRANLVNQYQIETSGGVYRDDGVEHDTITDITYLESGNDQVVSLSEVTVLLNYRKTDVAQRSSTAFGFITTSTTTRCAARIPYNDNLLYWDFGGVTEGTSRLTVTTPTLGDDIWAFTSKLSSGMRIIQNGKVITSNSGGVSRTQASHRFSLGRNTTIQTDLAVYGFTHIFNRNLSLDEIIELNVNPYQLVRSDPTIFLIDTTGPLLSSISSSSITDSSADVTWTTDEASDSVVEYGLTTGYGSSESNASLVTSHSISLSGLTAETLYHYRVKSTDAQGNESISSDNTFTTEADSSDVTGPVISNITASGLSAIGANISWTTDEASDSFVEYGLTTGYGANVSNASLVTSHSLAIEGLTAEMLYHYRVKSVDSSLNETVSADQTFTTTAASSSSHKSFALLGVG